VGGLGARHALLWAPPSFVQSSLLDLPFFLSLQVFI
jgi:hypothetical protein